MAAEETEGTPIAMWEEEVQRLRWKSSHCNLDVRFREGGRSNAVGQENTTGRPLSAGRAQRLLKRDFAGYNSTTTPQGMGPRTHASASMRSFERRCWGDRTINPPASARGDRGPRTASPDSRATRDPTSVGSRDLETIGRCDPPSVGFPPHPLHPRAILQRTTATPAIPMSQMSRLHTLLHDGTGTSPELRE
uniref:Uncharacterized protein n=1 Tax=Sphaerodactylus townsendi TaxID=933632 RepID=A0ACB8G9E4_9SAUR